MEPPVEIEDDREVVYDIQLRRGFPTPCARSSPAWRSAPACPRPRCAGGSENLRSSTPCSTSSRSVGVVLTDVHRVPPGGAEQVAPPTRSGSPASWDSPCSGTSAGPTTVVPEQTQVRLALGSADLRRFLRACTDSGAGIERVRRVRAAARPLLAEPELPAAAYGVHPTVHAQLAEDALEVGLDGVGRDEERRGDLLRGVHLRQQVEDLALPLRQRSDQDVVAPRVRCDRRQPAVSWSSPAGRQEVPMRPQQSPGSRSTHPRSQRPVPHHGTAHLPRPWPTAGPDRARMRARSCFPAGPRAQPDSSSHAWIWRASGSRSRSRPPPCQDGLGAPRRRRCLAGGGRHDLASTARRAGAPGSGSPAPVAAPRTPTAPRPGRSSGARPASRTGPGPPRPRRTDEQPGRGVGLPRRDQEPRFDAAARSWPARRPVRSGARRRPACRDGAGRRRSRRARGRSRPWRAGREHAGARVPGSAGPDQRRHWRSARRRSPWSASDMSQPSQALAARPGDAACAPG